MDFKQIQENIQKFSIETERIYTKMGTSFPSLLSITHETDSSSLSALKILLQNLSNGFSGEKKDEVDFFEQYNQKNIVLFTELNDKMTALDRINGRVAEIRSDSEELEIISLNAMVISIKSGDKGRAFSCITENLKSLSARMIFLSNALILDEKKLIEKNEALKTSFSAVLAFQKEVLSMDTSGASAHIVPIIGSATEALDLMKQRAVQVTSPIQNAMAGIQLQDIIRQSIDQVLLALPEVQSIARLVSTEEKLDQVTLNTELISVCSNITRDIHHNLETSIRTFESNWKEVHAILDSVEKLRLQFISTYLDSQNSENKSLPVLLEQLNTGFAKYITHINQYQRGQKTMVRDSSLIVSEVKHLRTLFDTIGPIIARLQHVRITQQIEVAKNSAISAVKDTVDYMSSLIMQSDSRVQETRRELESFIGDIEKLTTTFTTGSEVDNRELERIKQEKTAFFNKMREFQEEIASTVVNLNVYPDSFQLLCRDIDGELSSLKDISHAVSQISTEFDHLLVTFRAEQDQFFQSVGVSSWTIKNNRFKELINCFTITAHKEAASKIGGLTIETSSLEAIESGDVTLFF